MKNPVIIKGTKSGIIVVLNDEIDYNTLKQEVASKFSSSSDFLGNAQVAITYEGRELAQNEQIELTEIITENSNLDVVCIVDNDEEREAYFNKSLNERLMELNTNSGQFYKGNLRSGQVLEFETSIIIIGDVNAGAQVVSKGNVIILGALHGNVFAGASGNDNAFVVALDMNPKQIRISDTIARSPDKPDANHVKESKIAYLENGNIYIETLDRNVLSDIRL